MGVIGPKKDNFFPLALDNTNPYMLKENRMVPMKKQRNNLISTSLFAKPNTSKAMAWNI